MELRVNPIECVAHGLCAELLPEWIQLDEWGYPVIDSQPVPQQLQRQARRAANACPVRAMHLTEGTQLRVRAASAGADRLSS